MLQDCNGENIEESDEKGLKMDENAARAATPIAYGAKDSTGRLIAVATLTVEGDGWEAWSVDLGSYLEPASGSTPEDALAPWLEGGGTVVALRE